MHCAKFLAILVIIAASSYGTEEFAVDYTQHISEESDYGSDESEEFTNYNEINDDNEYDADEEVSIFDRNSPRKRVYCEEINVLFNYSTLLSDYKHVDILPTQLYEKICRSTDKGSCKHCSSRSYCAQAKLDTQIYFIKKKNNRKNLWTKHTIRNFRSGCTCSKRNSRT